jgi:hypothetical protein
MNSIRIILFLLFALLFAGCRQIFGDRDQPESIVQPPAEAEKIIITSPVHGSIWKKGDVINIKWIAPTIEYIQIQLYRKSAYKITIAVNIENKGIYEWIIPDDIAFSNHYLFKVSNQKESSVYNYSGRFAIQ